MSYQKNERFIIVINDYYYYLGHKQKGESCGIFPDICPEIKIKGANVIECIGELKLELANFIENKESIFDAIKNDGIKRLLLRRSIIKDLQIIVGYNGCGKTKLINYLSDSPRFRTLKFDKTIELNVNEDIKEFIFEEFKFKFNSALELSSEGIYNLVNLFSQLNQFDINKHDYFIVDDIELGLHITLQKDLIEKMQLFEPKASLIVTSHSPSIINGAWFNVTDMSDDNTTYDSLISELVKAELKCDKLIKDRF